MQSDDFEIGPFRPPHRPPVNEWPASDLDWVGGSEVENWLEYFSTRRAS
jgi:hypothetical protein